MRWFLKEANSPGEARCKKSWGRFEKCFSLSLRYVKQVSGKKRGPSLGKIQVKHPHQRSPYDFKFEDGSHEETERQQRCAGSNAWDLAKKYTSSKKDQVYILLARGKKRYSRLRQQKSRRKESLWWISVLVCMWSRETLTLNSAELETMRISRSPTTANGEVQTREEATVHVKQLDLFVAVVLLEETLEEAPEVLSLGKLCEDHGCTNHWTAVKKHTSPKIARELIAIYQTCAIRSPWFINEFLDNTHTYFIIIYITGFCI